MLDLIISIRDISSVLLALLLLFLIPVYSEPFGGCIEVSPFSFYLPCSVWPELARGVLFMLPLAVVAFNRSLFIMLGLIVSAGVVMGGGLEYWRSGEALNHIKQNQTVLFSAIFHPFFLGTVSVAWSALLYKVYQKYWSKRRV